jgi:RNA-directed DNA polymerase
LSKAKPFEISQEVVAEAFQRVKANKGAAGVDGESIADFEEDLNRNLYKIWNRMSSGTYMIPPVRSVEIPKDGGKGVRRLGVPTVADRVTQMVVKIYLESKVEPVFHVDSYGYRPGKSALDAVAKARERCWRYDWVIDLDIQGFFDNLDHNLVLRAVRKHTNCRWILLYIERCLKAPIQLEDGTLKTRASGSPQGSVISPLISNIFMHHAFDEWMRNRFPHVPFERYADDVVAHCRTNGQAILIRAAIAERLALCRLELHPEKTRIVYCKDANRRGAYTHERFDFLGYTFRPRSSRNRCGRLYVNFSPAVSDKALNAIRETIRSWELHYRTNMTLADLANFCNPQLRGWINYYGRFYKSALHRAFWCLDDRLVKWAQRKYKRLRTKDAKGWEWFRKVRQSSPNLFVRWRLFARSQVRVPGAG